MTKIEEVERAIKLAVEGWVVLPPTALRKAARAAIKAMRTPTEGMIFAANVTVLPPLSDYPGMSGIIDHADEVVRLQWEASIDAALADDGP